jgi:hypothetical protein
MILLEVGYCVAAIMAMFIVSLVLGRWAARTGVDAPEARAKRIAILWRLSETLLALVLLFVLWKYIAVGGGAVLIIAIIFTLLFGGVYVGGSLFAAITVPMGDQVAYFQEIERRRRG